MASFRIMTPAGVFKHLYGRRHFKLGPFVSVGTVILFLAIIIPRAASGSCFTNLASQYEISPEEKTKLERKHAELDKCMRAAVRRISETDKNWTFQTRTAGSSSPDKNNESTKSNQATLVHVVGTVPGAVATGRPIETPALQGARSLPLPVLYQCWWVNGADTVQVHHVLHDSIEATQKSYRYYFALHTVGPNNEERVEGIGDHAVLAEYPGNSQLIFRKGLHFVSVVVMTRDTIKSSEIAKSFANYYERSITDEK